MEKNDVEVGLHDVVPDDIVLIPLNVLEMAFSSTNSMSNVTPLFAACAAYFQDEIVVLTRFAIMRER